MALCPLHLFHNESSQRELRRRHACQAPERRHARRVSADAPAIRSLGLGRIHASGSALGHMGRWHARGGIAANHRFRDRHRRALHRGIPYPTGRWIACRSSPGKRRAPHHQSDGWTQLIMRLKGIAMTCLPDAGLTQRWMIRSGCKDPATTERTFSDNFHSKQFQAGIPARRCQCSRG